MRSQRRHYYLRAVRASRTRSRARHRSRVLALVLMVGVLGAALLTAWPAAMAASDGVYRDDFNSISYSNSDGSLSWSGSPWVEVGESNGPGSDPVSVGSWSTRCASGNCIRINDITQGTPYGFQRSADLSGAAAAVLTFSYALELDAGDDDSRGPSTFVVMAGPTATGPWTSLATYTVTASISSPIPQAFDLTPYIGTSTTIRVMSDGIGWSHGIYLDDVQIEAVPAADLEPSLWFVISDDTTTGPPALPALKDGAIGSFTDPGLQYEPGVTAGTLGTLADWEVLFGVSDLDGLHLVTTNLTVGGMSLQVGDLLFILSNDLTLTGSNGGSIGYNKNDVGRFRPDVPGDYRAGTFATFLDNPLNNDLNGLTLVEQSTRVGEVTLTSGTLLLTRMGGTEHQDVYRYVVTTAGEGTTSGTTSKLLEGSEMGFIDQIWDLDLIEDGMGWPFPRGAIALTFEKDVLIGIDGTAAPKRTIVSVIVARTSLSAAARVNAIVAWDGNDLGFNEDKERLEAFTFADYNLDPVFDQDITDRSEAEGTAVSFSATGTDPLGEGLTYSATGLPPGVTYGATTGLVSGTVDYTAAAGSPYLVVLTVTDPHGSTDTDTFTWTVTNVNRPPVLNDHQDRTDAEGAVISLALVGDDPDAGSITWSATGLPPGLVIDPGTGVISGTISYDASPGSPYAITVRVTDDGTPVLWVEDTFQWTVTDTNRAPVVTNPGDQTGAEGDAVPLAVVGSDPDGDTLTWTASNLPAGLAIDPGTGVITGTISYGASVNSPYSVLVQIFDDGTPVTRTEVTFTWTVTDTNRAPVVTNPGDRSNGEGDPVTFAIAGSDPDGDGLTWTATGLPPGLAIASASGTITGSVSYDASSGSPFAVAVRATDDGLLYDEVSFQWTVTDTDRAPVVSDPGSQVSAEGETIDLAVSGSDPDGDALTWNAAGLPPGLSIDSVTGTVTGVLGFAASGVRTVTLYATDTGSLFDEVSVAWTVSETNRAPTAFNPGDQTTAEGSVVTLGVVASDPDGNALDFAAAGLPPGLTIDMKSGVVTGTLGFNLGDVYAVVVTVTDDGSPVLESQVGFDWFIGEVNRSPVVAAIPDRNSEQGVAVTMLATATDPDGDVIGWSATGLPAGVTMDPASGVISGTPSVPGAYGVSVTATDGGTPPARDVETFSWIVASPPDFPAIEEISTRRDLEGEPVSFVAAASHPDGLAITWAAQELPLGMVIDPATGRISGVPATAGTWFTRVTVTDERDQQATASFVWIVESTADLPPIPGDDTITVGIDEITAGGIALDAAGNDADPEGLGVRLVSLSQPQVGEAELVDGMVVFRPPSGWLGTVIIRYVVADPAGNEAEGRITLTVLDSLDNRLVTGTLTGGAGPGVVDLGALGALTPAAGTEMLLSSVFQSLYVLRVPLALLGGAVFWSLLLGGILNLGFVLRGGVPRLVRRTSRNVAVVLVPHGGRVDVLSEPGRGELLTRLTATQRGIEATGRRIVAPDGEEWAEIRTEVGVGWAPAFHLTEEVDRSGFAADPEAMDVVKEFVDRLRARREFSDLVSQHGLFVAHHAPLVHFAPGRLSGVMDDPTRLVWKGRNPAYPDFSRSFDLAVATGVLDAFDHPMRDLLHDRPAAPSTVIPVEFTNLHFVSIGADVHGPERLEQSAWLVMVSYEAAHPKIVGLVREG